MASILVSVVIRETTKGTWIAGFVLIGRFFPVNSTESDNPDGALVILVEKLNYAQAPE